MDPSFEELHKTIMNDVENTLRSIVLNMQLGSLKKNKSKLQKYASLQKALSTWKEIYGSVSSEDEVVQGIVLLNNILYEIK